MTRGGLAWLGVAFLLGAVALIGWCLPGDVPHESIDWQPAQAFSQPWRAFTAVGVHYSGQHLGVNLGGLALTALFGVVARATTPLAWAWLAAWPLTQLGLLIEPRLLHYGGLSGVLHAGVAIVVTFLLITGTRAQRRVAGALAVGLVAKLLSEAPWGEPLRHPAGWDIAIAPIAHTTGAIAGAACAMLALLMTRAAPPPHV